MSWATTYIETLKRGETVQFRPVGSSMSGRIESGQLVTVVPHTTQVYQVDDIVLCTVKGKQYLHLIKQVNKNGKWYYYQIGNNKGGINGWITSDKIYGIYKK